MKNCVMIEKIKATTYKKNKLFTLKAKSIRRNALEILTINKTRLLFHLSTYTPAITPKIIAGIVNDNTTAELAAFEWVVSKTTRRRKKLKILVAVRANISPIQA
jgi:hypothetical protein